MKLLPNTIKIRLFGTGCLIVKGIINHELWKNLKGVSAKLNTDFEKAVLDAEFFTLLNDSNYKSFHDLGNIKYHGLLYDNRSHIELKINSKHKRIIKLIDIIQDNLLFPLFNSEKIEITDDFGSERSVLIIETEIGLIASFELFAEKFDINNLQFKIYNLKTDGFTFTLIGGLTYNNEILNSIKSDSLVSQNLIFVKNIG